MMYLKLENQTTANVIATEVETFTAMSKKYETITAQVYSEADGFYVKAVDEYDYSQHPVQSVVQILPSVQTEQYIDNLIVTTDTFGSELMKRFKNENIRTGISQVPGATARVLEVMQTHYKVAGSLNGVSLNEVLGSGSITVAPELIDMIIADIQANPDDYSLITTWINETRMEEYKQIIIAQLS